MAVRKSVAVVTNIVSSGEVLRQILPPFTHVEVREKQNGSWHVFYPDPGWIPCAPGCRLAEVMKSHKHDYEQGWIETHYEPVSYLDAIRWAELLAEGRAVKILPYLTIAERNAAAKGLTPE